MMAIDPKQVLTRTDADGIPCLVQAIRYYSTLIEFDLFAGGYAHIYTEFFTSVDVTGKDKLSEEDFQKIEAEMTQLLLNNWEEINGDLT